MERIISNLVADGVIGGFNIKWKVLERYDTKHGDSFFDLFIHDQHIKSCVSVAEALKVLLDYFEE